MISRHIILAALKSDVINDLFTISIAFRPARIVRTSIAAYKNKLVYYWYFYYLQDVSIYFNKSFCILVYQTQITLDLIRRDRAWKSDV
jgi:hypothetical protein